MLRTIIYTFIYIICIFICGGSAPARSVSRDDKIPADEETGENGDRFLVSAALLGLFFSLTRAKPAHRSFMVYFPPADVRLFLRETSRLRETRKPGTGTRKLELFNLAINLSPLPFQLLAVSLSRKQQQLRASERAVPREGKCQRAKCVLLRAIGGSNRAREWTQLEDTFSRVAGKLLTDNVTRHCDKTREIETGQNPLVEYKWVPSGVSESSLISPQKRSARGGGIVATHGNEWHAPIPPLGIAFRWRESLSLWLSSRLGERAAASKAAGTIAMEAAESAPRPQEEFHLRNVHVTSPRSLLSLHDRATGIVPAFASREWILTRTLSRDASRPKGRRAIDRGRPLRLSDTLWSKEKENEKREHCN